MIPIDPLRPVIPPANPLKITRIVPIEPDVDPQDGTYSERRKRNDRRQLPFRHRGPFEHRSGRDRRDRPHIDEEV